MTLPVTIPNTFANATTSIPLANLDANFVTIYGAVNGIGNGAEALANVNISGGTVANAAVSNTSVSATTLNTSGQVVFNDAGADVDFRVEGDTDANLLFVDASADKVGIGTTSPSVKLQVKGSVSNAHTSFRVSDSDDRSLLFESPYNGASSANIKVDGSGLPLAFFTGGAERIRVTDNGLTFNGDTAAANALDDYEEGTFTPALEGTVSNPTGTPSATNLGHYTKVGRLVSFRANVIFTSVSGGSGNLRISGLPFTSGFYWTIIPIGYTNTQTDVAPATGMIRENTSKIEFWMSSSTSNPRANIISDYTVTSAGNTFDWYITGNYYIA